MTLVLILFVAAGLRILILSIFEDSRISLKRLKKNEVAAYENLKRIADAQNAYFQKSRAMFGESSYSTFLTHLWTAVDPSGQPVKLDLIPEKLAVAVGPTKAEQGYYFIDLRERHDLQKNPVKLNIESAWAVAAVPRLSGQSGSLVYLTDQTGDIFAIPAGKYASRHPLDPAAAGWLFLPSIDALKSGQTGYAGAN